MEYLTTFIDFAKSIAANYDVILTQAAVALGALTAFLAALYAICLAIPGEQPDKAIKAVLDFTQKFSVKEEDE